MVTEKEAIDFLFNVNICLVIEAFIYTMAMRTKALIQKLTNNIKTIWKRYRRT